MGREPKSASEKAEEQRYLVRLGKHLKELREIKHLTVRDLADKLDVKPQYIYMIEKGRAKPSERRLNQLASALGDLADEFLATAVTRVEDEFTAKLTEAGLSPTEIEEAARRVSARAKRDVVSGKEPLRVTRNHAPEGELFDALPDGEEIVAMDSLSLGEDVSAYSYAESLKDEFEESVPPTAQALTGQFDTQSTGRPIEAGPDASIVVNRPVTREERKALQDIGRVIAHLLKR